MQRTFTSSARRYLRPPPPTTSSTPEPGSDKSRLRDELSKLWASPSPKSRGLIPSSSSEHDRRVNGGRSDSDLMMAYRNSNSALKASSQINEGMFTKMIVPYQRGSIPGGTSPFRPPVAQRQKPAPMRLTPSTGRTVSVAANAGVDVGRAFALLAQSCARNGVRRDHNAQKFHERPGLKRKRLHRMRWRRRFMTGFKAAVIRVKQLRKQGW